MSQYKTKNVNGVEVPLTPQEIAELEARDAEWRAEESDRLWERIRTDRDDRLARCDFRVLPDYPGTDREDWEVYRQALRDITEQTDPKNIVWPEEPK